MDPDFVDELEDYIAGEYEGEGGEDNDGDEEVADDDGE